MKRLLPVKVLLLSLLILIWAKNSMAQDVPTQSLFLNLDGKELKYFSLKHDRDGKEPLNKKHTLTLSSNFTSIYFSWLNPLKYEVIWKDSIYLDERDKMVQDFASLLMGQFGLAAAQIGKSNGIGPIVAYDGGIAPGKEQAIDRMKYDTEYFDSDLAEFNMLFELYSSRTGLSEDEKKQHEQIRRLLIVLDRLDYNNAYNVPKDIKAIFQKLYSIEKAGDLANIVNEQKLRIDAIVNRFDEIKEDVNKIPILLEMATKGTNNNLSIYTKSIVTNFINRVEVNLKNNQTLVSKIKPLFDKLNNSVSKKSYDVDNYYLVRDVKFDEGKVLETEITIMENEFDTETTELKRKSNIYQSKIIFQQYDSWQIGLSGGIFYSSATIKGFGVAADENGRLIVTEDSFTKNSPVTALFLNLNLKMSSRYFSPGIQVGIDPTKRHPYLLFGTGFAIPAASLSITGGPVWAWYPKLENLSVGDVINSTTELEKDIQYSINIVPNGWYLGIQYNLKK